jgi:hypothetical protein
VVAAVTELELEEGDAGALVDFWEQVCYFTVIVINI